MAQESLGIPDCLSVVVARFKACNKLLERCDVPLTQPLALAEEPFVVAGREQVVRVELDGIAQPGDALRRARCPFHRDKQGLEGGDIEPAGRLYPPLQGTRLHVEEPISLRQGMAEGMQHVPQVRARLGLGRVRPEQKGEMLAWLRRITVEQEVGKQRLGARGLERGQGGLAVAQVERAEQPYAQHWCRHSRQVSREVCVSIIDGSCSRWQTMEERPRALVSDKLARTSRGALSHGGARPARHAPAPGSCRLPLPAAGAAVLGARPSAAYPADPNALRERPRHARTVRRTLLCSHGHVAHASPSRIHTIPSLDSTCGSSAATHRAVAAKRQGRARRPPRGSGSPSVVTQRGQTAVNR